MKLEYWKEKSKVIKNWESKGIGFNILMVDNSVLIRLIMHVTYTSIVLSTELNLI